MPKIVFVDYNGAAHVVDAVRGESLMTAAVRVGVPGIIGECGGNASCATCHVWLQGAFVDALGGPGDLEDDLLDLAVSERRPGSRLGCQVSVDDSLEGLVVDVPPPELF